MPELDDDIIPLRWGLSPCGHSAQYAWSEDGGKNIDCLLCLSWTARRATRATRKEPICEDWLKSIGFKWHQLERQPEKQWLLWLGDVVFWRDGGFRFMGGEDLGVEVSQGSYHWKCWLRGDYAHRYSRFIFVRDLHFQHELIALIEAITSQTFDPRNNFYGSMRIPEHAAKIREEDERRAKRLDARMLQSNWREIEKDDSRGRPLPEHLQVAEDARCKKKSPGEN